MHLDTLERYDRLPGPPGRPGLTGVCRAALAHSLRRGTVKRAGDLVVHSNLLGKREQARSMLVE
ncbi:MAG TPA: hypothetical protein VMU55_04715 [Solirubrobacteraceae bacterium]|nr:hypothetical protein [Solirubrobacteraceae bacterium]